MKVPIDRINSLGIRAEMAKDSYTTADLIGTYQHPQHPGSRDWDVTLYRAADTLVFDTNGDPVWQGYGTGFDELVTEYGIDQRVIAEPEGRA
jgi:hypothetical protein